MHRNVILEGPAIDGFGVDGHEALGEHAFREGDLRVADEFVAEEILVPDFQGERVSLWNLAPEPESLLPLGVGLVLLLLLHPVELEVFRLDH